MLIAYASIANQNKFFVLSFCRLINEERQNKENYRKEVNPAHRSVETMQPSEGHFFVKTNNLLHFIIAAYDNFHSFCSILIYFTFMLRHVASYTPYID